MMKIGAEYALYINPAQITTIYQDHNQHWHATMSDQSDVQLTESEARRLTGVVNHSMDLADPGVPIGPAAPVGWGPEMGG